MVIVHPWIARHILIPLLLVADMATPFHDDHSVQETIHTSSKRLPFVSPHSFNHWHIREAEKHLKVILLIPTFIFSKSGHQQTYVAAWICWLTTIFSRTWDSFTKTEPKRNLSRPETLLHPPPALEPALMEKHLIKSMGYRSVLGKLNFLASREVYSKLTSCFQSISAQDSWHIFWPLVAKEWLSSRIVSHSARRRPLTHNLHSFEYGHGKNIYIGLIDGKEVLVCRQLTYVKVMLLSLLLVLMLD